MKDCMEMLKDIDEYGSGLTVENGKFLADMMEKAEKERPVRFTVGQMRYIRSLWQEKVPDEWK